MCNLSDDVEVVLKTKTVYKICIKRDGKYYSLFSGMQIKKGRVKDMGWVDARDDTNRFASMVMVGDWRVNIYHEDDTFFNHLAVGRTTGFACKSIAKMMQGEMYDESTTYGGLDTVLLKMKIAGDLVQGTAETMTNDPKLKKAKVFAGREILSVKEV